MFHKYTGDRHANLAFGGHNVLGIPENIFLGQSSNFVDDPADIFHIEDATYSWYVDLKSRIDYSKTSFFLDVA